KGSDLCPGPFRRRAKPGEMRTVRRDDGGAALLQPFENLRLGVGYGFFGAEHLDMGRRNGGYDRDMRPDLGGERRYLACVVHAHLDHAVFAARRHAREAERNADVVVVALDRTVRPPPAGPLQRGEYRLLDTGLAY